MRTRTAIHPAATRAGQLAHLARLALLALAALLAVGAPALAQDSARAKKPGGLNKVAREVSATSKKAGRKLKENVKDLSADAHRELTKAGKDTKAELKRTTGITSKSPSATHKPGGVNKVARDISSASKKAGAKLKGNAKKGSSHAHHELTKAGKDTKAAAKAANDSIRKP